VRHTLATWLRQRGVPAWEISGLLGHHAGGTTDTYAKFDLGYIGPACAALTEIIEDVGEDVPRMRALLGLTLGSPCVIPESTLSTSSLAVSGLRVVGGTGFEPVTPTMSR